MRGWGRSPPAPHTPLADSSRTLRGVSRRAELTPEIISHVETEVRRAHFPVVVARKLGIHKKTWEGWMKEGEQAHLSDTDGDPGDAHYLERTLFERIEEAEAYAEMELLNMAREQAQLGKTSWNGFLTTLERRFSDRWRKREPSAGDINESWEAQVRKHLLAQRDVGAPEKLHAVE